MSSVFHIIFFLSSIPFIINKCDIIIIFFIWHFLQDLLAAQKQQERLANGENTIYKASGSFGGVYYAYHKTPMVDVWPVHGLFMAKNRNCMLVKEFEEPPPKTPERVVKEPQSPKKPTKHAKKPSAKGASKPAAPKVLKKPSLKK